MCAEITRCQNPRDYLNIYIPPVGLTISVDIFYQPPLDSNNYAANVFSLKHRYEMSIWLMCL